MTITITSGKAVRESHHAIDELTGVDRLIDRFFPKLKRIPSYIVSNWVFAEDIDTGAIFLDAASITKLPRVPRHPVVILDEGDLPYWLGRIARLHGTLQELWRFSLGGALAHAKEYTFVNSADRDRYYDQLEHDTTDLFETAHKAWFELDCMGIPAGDLRNQREELIAKYADLKAEILRRHRAFRDGTVPEYAALEEDYLGF
jgi:hypothetical protein